MGGVEKFFYIHGGGWNKGSKESQTSFTSWFKKGYAVANIGYRLVQTVPGGLQGKFPKEK